MLVGFKAGKRHEGRGVGGGLWHVGRYLSQEGSGRSFFCSAACCSLTNIRGNKNVWKYLAGNLVIIFTWYQHHCCPVSRSMERKEKVSCKSFPDWKWPFELLSPIAMMMMMVIPMHMTLMVMVTDWKRFIELFLSFTAFWWQSFQEGRR